MSIYGNDPEDRYYSHMLDQYLDDETYDNTPTPMDEWECEACEVNSVWVKRSAQHGTIMCDNCRARIKEFTKK